MTLRFVVLVAATAVLGACSEPNVSIYPCVPPCPSGTECTADGCVARDRDLSAAPPSEDLGPCNPGCLAPTPFCNASSQCVPCLVDGDCGRGKRCVPVGQGSACVPGCKADGSCAPGEACCNGACTQVASDPANCGRCGQACGAPNLVLPTCASGVCGGTCAPGWADCNASSVDGCETHVVTDNNNCGACGSACPALPHATAHCSGTCYLAACDQGFADCDGEFADGCEQDINGDVHHCGGCASDCGARAHATVRCRVGRCQLTACDAGWTDCDGNPANGCEINTGTDVANCGSCGHVCGNGLVCINGKCDCRACNIGGCVGRCVNGRCIFPSCGFGFSDCGFDPCHPVCVDILSDPANCGDCGIVCPMAKPNCVFGFCQ